MTERVPDPIERGEARMEAWADENWRDGKFLCPGCGEWTPDEDAHMISPDPYSPPGCGKCLEERYGSKCLEERYSLNNQTDETPPETP